MALAQLCASLNRPESKTCEYHVEALVVDHRAREGSAAEAYSVTRELGRMGIASRVLTLDWKNHGGSSGMSRHFEADARQLRYRALALACREQNLHALVVGHHAGDVAETVIQRVTKGITGSGLHGISPIKNIPECGDIYGVSESGSPVYPEPANNVKSPSSRRRSVAVESGGIPLLRPMLELSKPELINICMTNNVQWFEDATNADVTLTSRNTIRYLQQSNLLPVALGRDAALKIADMVSHEKELAESAADGILQGLSISLDIRKGSLECRIPHSLPQEISKRWPHHRLIVSARLVTQLTSLLQHNDSIKGHALLQAVECILDGGGSTASACCLGELQITRTKENSRASIVRMHVRPLPRTIKQPVLLCPVQKVQLKVGSSTQRALDLQWTLWSGRYWIGLCSVQSNPIQLPSIYIRALREEDLQRLRRDYGSTSRTRRHLDNSLRLTSGLTTRFSIPALVMRAPHQARPEEAEHEEMVMVLPSIGWSRPGWLRWTSEPSMISTDLDHELRREGQVWIWDVRYKNIDRFLRSESHQVLNEWPLSRTNARHKPLDDNSEMIT